MKRMRSGGYRYSLAHDLPSPLRSSSARPRSGRACGGTTSVCVRSAKSVRASLDALLALLKRDGPMALVGAPATPHPSPDVFHLIMKRGDLADTMISGSPKPKRCRTSAPPMHHCHIGMIRADEIEGTYEWRLTVTKNTAPFSLPFSSRTRKPPAFCVCIMRSASDKVLEADADGRSASCPGASISKERADADNLSSIDMRDEIGDIVVGRAPRLPSLIGRHRPRRRRLSPLCGVRGCPASSGARPRAGPRAGRPRWRRCRRPGSASPCPWCSAAST